MRCLVLLLALLGYALAQTLVAPPNGRVGEPFEIRGSEFPAGKYSLEVEGPAGVEKINLEPVGGSFLQNYTPQKDGTYSLRVRVGEKTLQARTQVGVSTPTQPSAPPPPTSPASPQLVADGLQIGSWKLPLKGQWTQPRMVGRRAYIASGPLVLEIDLVKPAVVGQYYPPLEVRAIETDPEVTLLLEDNRRLSLSALKGRPYEGKWESLKTIQDYFETLDSAKASDKDQSPLADRPYWYYFTKDPSTITPADLQAIGYDLFQRGHRPELAWGSGVMQWIQPWLLQIRSSRAEGIDSSLVWSEFFLKYLPQVPGAKTMLGEQAGWFEAQGRSDLAQRYREGLRQLAAWQNPLGSSSLMVITWVLLGLYGLLWVYFFLIYLPAQLRGLGRVGWLLGWFTQPMLRLRHSSLAYTSLGERLWMLMLFLLSVLALLGWGLGRRAEAIIWQDALSRGTLRSYAAQETLRNLTNSAPIRGLLAYSLAKENPEEARRLYTEAPAWAYVLIGRGTPGAIGQAYTRAPEFAAAREALGLSGDLWTSVYKEAQVVREGVPTPRVIAASVGFSGLQALTTNFPEIWPGLPIWPRPAWAWGVGILLLLATLYQVVFLVPRPRGAAENLAWRRGVQFFVPGSPWFSQGWGITLLLAFVGGVWLWRTGIGGGLWLGVLALLTHWLLWFMSRQRNR